ncbi:MAG: TIGR01212 family radical SAM protein [Peptoniphilaceae bacterium]|nr:TIGR01212 family radical SAM protein [Peptoniphilaceae bacterium]MDY3738028.1 TIGR01212 family radical SAM protein [Peptoniphilaceae bacterium]
MEINKKRYNDIDSFFKRKFNKKMVKLPIDGGFSCPNRDGKISKKGCIYCSIYGSGDFTYHNNRNIKEQLNYQKNLLSKKNREEFYIAYFQNFTNTYADKNYLKRIYNEVLNIEFINGISIATRADCLNDDVLEILNELNKKTFLFVELGLQSVNDKTIKFINRGYNQKTFDEGISKLIDLNIKTVVHLIVGLPNENKKDFLNDIFYVNEKNIWGIKIHNLYIQEETPLFLYYKKNPFNIMEKNEYIQNVIEMLEFLKPNITIHRLTGDGPKEKIIEPKRSKNKASVLSTIDKILKEKNIRQGDKYIKPN